MTPLANLVAAVGILTANTAQACFMEIGVGNGMATSDPLSIPVLLTAREAAEDGEIEMLDMDGSGRLSTAVAMLSYLPRILDGRSLEGSPLRFAVLQAQSGYWTRYAVRNGIVRADGHLSVPGDVDAVLVVSDAALLEVLRGGSSLTELAARGLLRYRGELGSMALDRFSVMLASHAGDQFARSLRQTPLDFRERPASSEKPRVMGAGR